MDDNDDVDTNYDDDDETNESDTINIIMMMTKIWHFVITTHL